jgi:hypothetical protein
MEILKSLFEKKNIGQLILCILFIIFLLSSKVPIPYSFAKVVDTKIGIIIIIIILILLICYVNPIVSILAILVVYELMKRSSMTVGKNNLEDYYPIQEKKWSPYSAHHQFPYTLEQEIVNKMSKNEYNSIPSKPTYKPILENNYNASSLDLNNQ